MTNGSAEDTTVDDEAMAKAEKMKKLRAEIQKLNAVIDHFGKEKSKTKKAIKAWISDFETTNGRAPTNEDKEAARSIYVDHKKVCTCLLHLFLLLPLSLSRNALNAI